MATPAATGMTLKVVGKSKFKLWNRDSKVAHSNLCVGVGSAE